MNSNNTCISGHCNRFGTLDRTPKGECICQIGFVGDRCEYCDKGYVSSLPVDHESVCDICQIGYHKDGNTCQEGKCDQERTEQVDPTGRCHCKVGYSGAQCNECAQGHSGDDCDHCNSGFVMDKRGICHGILAYILILHFLVLFQFISEGDCNPVGTQNRTTNGSCICNPTFEGAHCDQCITGYLGSECDQCDEHFFFMDGECKSCHLAGTRSLFGNLQYNTDGSCKCYPEFEGFLCQDCKPGHSGSLCQYCNETTYKSSSRECICK